MQQMQQDQTMWVIARLTDWVRHAFANRLARAGVSLCLVGLLFTFVDLSETARVVASADPWLMALGLFLVLPDLMLSAWRWYYLLHDDHPRLHFWDVVRVVIVSSYIGLFMPGQVGVELVRVYGLRHAGVGLAASAASLLVERLFAVVGLVVLLSTCLLLSRAHLPVAAVVVAVGSLAATCVGAAFLFLGSVRRAVHRLIPGFIDARIKPNLDHLYSALDRYRTRKKVLHMSLVFGMVFQVFRVLQTYVFALSLGIEIDPLLFMGLVPFVQLATMIPITLAGIGVREASFVFVLGTAGVPAESSFALSVLLFAVMVVSNLPGALLINRPLAERQSD